MNNERRKELDRALDMLVIAKAIIDTARAEEDEDLYNLPEALQQSERGLRLVTNVSELEDAILSIESAVGSIAEATLTHE